jgi:uncharacterized membrane protein (DUF485 family)
MNEDLKPIASLMSILMLVLYVGTFLVFAYHGLFVKSDEPSIARGPSDPAANEAIAFAWTATSVLVAGVVAVAFGQQPKTALRSSRWPTAADLIRWYAWTFVGVGTLAVIVWAINGSGSGNGFFKGSGGDTPLLIKNAATAFLGLVAPIVTAYLRPPRAAEQGA